LNLQRLANAYLRQAESRLKDAAEAVEDKNYPYAVRLSQECTELSVKAALRSVGIEYPKQHEVSDLLSELRPRFPPWFASEIPGIQEASKALYRKRDLAFYGGEESLMTPEDLIGQEDAEKAVSSASHVFQACKRLVREAIL